jgi:hypothetical protein
VILQTGPGQSTHQCGAQRTSKKKRKAQDKA